MALNYVYSRIRNTRDGPKVNRKKSNGSQCLKRVKEIVYEAINHVTPEHWRKCMNLTQKVEDEFRAKKIGQEYFFEQFMINTASDESDVDDPSEESDIESV